MKKYISILLAAVLSVSLLAGCGGSDNSGKKPAEEAQEQAAQPEGTEQAQPSLRGQSRPSLPKMRPRRTQPRQMQPKMKRRQLTIPQTPALMWCASWTRKQ